ncbi:unnamed protein product [Cuscuta campestris]|uniref:Remorin C-terminal domain-containing protein n=1 Tax=Cuscuta campestris TaxID=132261 RepID=A0A484LFW0_9ASTE|nr:unnamed protein product [Cuscuta campestris]
MKGKIVAFAPSSSHDYDEDDTHNRVSSFLQFSTTSPPNIADDGMLRGTENPWANDGDWTRIELEKRWALIKAWEENEKAKADNKAHKELCAVAAWESSKKASLEVKLKQIEEEYEKRKGEYEEKMKNKAAEIHREAEERRAQVEAEKGEGMLKLEEAASNFRSSGYVPHTLRCRLCCCCCCRPC